MKFLFILLVNLILFMGCSEKNDRIDKIEFKPIVGSILPLSGNAAVYGESCQKGINIASKQYDIPVVFEDSKVEAKEAISAFYKLINYNKVNIIIGDMFSGSTLAIAPIAERKSIFLISPTASAKNVPTSGKYIFSLYPNGIVEAKYLSEKLKTYFNVLNKYIGIIYQKGSAFEDLSTGVKEGIKKENLTIAFTESITSNTNIKSLITRLKNKYNNSIIYIATDNTLAPKIIKEAKIQNWKVEFYSQSVFYDNTLLEKYPNILNGVLFTAPYFDIENKSEFNQKFVNEYISKYKSKPDVWAAYCYDSIALIDKIYKNCSNECTKNNFLNDLKNLYFKGITGDLKFDSNGAAIKTFKIYKIVNNTMKIISKDSK